MATIEDKIGRVIQGDIPLADKRPYRRIADMTGTDEQTVIETIGMFLRQGVMRKFGAILRHQRAGYSRNAMVLWAVAAERAEAVGTILSSRREVTHCYLRTPAFAGKYSLFTMVHFQDQAPEEQVLKLARAAGIEDYRILESLEEFKKSSMEYF